MKHNTKSMRLGQDMFSNGHLLSADMVDCDEFSSWHLVACSSFCECEYSCCGGDDCDGGADRGEFLFVSGWGGGKEGGSIIAGCVGEFTVWE